MKKLSEKRKYIWNETMKAEILNATLKVLDESGYSGLTMARVAKTLGVATGTLYNYYKNKDELLIAVIASLVDPMIRRIRAIMEADPDMAPVQKLSSMMQAGFLEFQENWNQIRVLINARPTKLHRQQTVQEYMISFRDELNSIYEQVLEQGMAQGCFRAVDTRLTARMLNAFVKGLLEEEIDFPEDGPPFSEKYASAFISLILRGISAAPGPPDAGA